MECAIQEGYPSAAEPSVEVTLLAGYPKQDKLEQVIRHGVELGCSHFVPFFSRYCVAAPKKEEQKNVRYNRIAYEAAKQCGRGILPDVALPLPNFGAGVPHIFPVRPGTVLLRVRRRAAAPAAGPGAGYGGPAPALGHRHGRRGRLCPRGSRGGHCRRSPKRWAWAPASCAVRPRRWPCWQPS